MFKKTSLNLVLVLFAIFLITGCGPEEYLVNLEKELEEAGTVSGDGSFDKSEEVVVEAQPEEGYRFVGWEKDGKKISEEKSYRFKIDQDTELVAVFEEDKEYSLEVFVEPEGAGSITGEGTYRYGEKATLHAEPAENYGFVKWLQEGREVSRSPEYTFEVQEDKKIEARFDGPEPLLYQIKSQALTYEEIIRKLWHFEVSVILIDEDEEGNEIFGETRYFDEDGKVTIKVSNFNFELYADSEFSRVHLGKWDISPEEVGFHDSHLEVIKENQLEDKKVREGGSGYTVMYMFREVPAGSSIELELSPPVKEYLDLETKHLSIEVQE